MGLSFYYEGIADYPDRANWSYSGFYRFRRKLANEVFIPLDDMAGYKKGGHSWEKIVDPIKYLLNHSDCEGDLSPEECAMIAPRLRFLVNNWHKDDYDRVNALLLADHMEACSNLDVTLNFR